MIKIIMHIYLIFLISPTAHTVSAQDIQSHLEFCNDSCACEQPFLTQVQEYTIRPDDIKKKTVQCTLSLDEVSKLLKCIRGITGLVKRDCIKENGRTLSKRSRDNQCNFKSTFIYPPTLKVTEKAPENCGYKWKHFNRPEYLKLTVNFIENNQIKCSKSMCTSATFLALIAHAKKLFENKKITKEEFDELTIPHRKAYKMLNTSAEPNELVESFGIGTGHVFDMKDKKLGAEGIPQLGDLAQIWRKNGSGHSVVFKGFIDEDNDGEKDFMCYWSSQKVSNGYGHVCEKIASMSKVLVGHFSGKVNN